MEETGILNKLKQSSVFKAVAAYAAVSFVLIQVASLVSDTFGLNQDFMQNMIWVFLVGFPFLALIAWASSSRFSTFKILGIFLVVLLTGYGSGSYIWVHNFVLPELKKELEKDDYVGAWDKVNLLNSYEWRYLGTSPIKNTRLPKGVMKLKLEKEGFKTKFLVDANPSFLFDNHPIDLGWELPAIQMYTEKTIPEGMVPIDGGRFIPALIGEGVTEYNLSTYYID